MRFGLPLALTLAVAPQAQDPRGTITGQVTDRTGGVVAGAVVGATNVDTNVKVSAGSNAQGSYEIPYLLPGIYKLEAEKQGFRTWSRSGVELRMSDRMQVDISLEIGSVDQTVEVTAEAPLAREYEDYRRVLEQKDIDVVVIATPDHWHTPMALDAISAGKDIYLEKPVTHTLEEGPRMLAAVEGSKRVVQTGTQNRSMPHFIQAREIVASRALGQIALVETYFYQNYLRIDPARFSVDASKLDWKGFLGPAPDQPFDRLRFVQWRWYWDFGGGTLTDLFTHVVDVAHWFLGKDMPAEASARGTNSLLPRWQTPDTVNACFQYPGGLIVVFNAMMGGSLQGGGTLFRGTKAMMRISRSGFELWDEPDESFTQGPVTVPPKLQVKAQGDVVLLHVQNFLECVRSRRTPNAPLAAGIACARAIAARSCGGRPTCRPRVTQLGCHRADPAHDADPRTETSRIEVANKVEHEGLNPTKPAGTHDVQDVNRSTKHRQVLPRFLQDRHCSSGSPAKLVIPDSCAPVLTCSDSYRVTHKPG